VNMSTNMSFYTIPAPPKGLDHIAMQNSMFLQSPDVLTAMMAGMSKSVATFSKL
jgi:hypothetical protein